MVRVSMNCGCEAHADLYGRDGIIVDDGEMGGYDCA